MRRIHTNFSIILYNIAQDWVFGSPVTTTAIWTAGTPYGSLVITVPIRSGYEGTYELEVSYDGTTYFTDSAPYSIGDTSVTFTLVIPTFNEIASNYYRVFTPDGNSPAYSSAVQPTEGSIDGPSFVHLFETKVVQFNTGGNSGSFYDLLLNLQYDPPITLNNVSPFTFQDNNGNFYSLTYDPIADAVILDGPEMATYTFSYNVENATYSFNGAFFYRYVETNIISFSLGGNSGSFYDLLDNQVYPLIINNISAVEIGDGYVMTYDSFNDTIVVTTGSTDTTFTRMSAIEYSFNNAILTVSGNGDVGGGVVPCFLGNAPILTSGGYRRIDSLAAGDMILSAAGSPIEIKRVSVTRCQASSRTNPYIIPKGKFGAIRDLLISPDHKIAIHGAMIKAKDIGLTQKKREGEITYYNLELPTWTNMVVAGVEVESLAPVRRVTMTIHQLASLLTKKYGSVATSDTVLQRVLRTCRLRSDGLIEAPVIRR